MEPDDHVCICFRVSLRKLSNFIERERPAVASQLSECLGAGTGCQWCVPHLERLHACWKAGEPLEIRGSASEHVMARAAWRKVRREQREAERDLAAGPADGSRRGTPPPASAEAGGRRPPDRR